MVIGRWWLGLRARREQAAVARRAIPDDLWKRTLVRYPFLRRRDAADAAELRSALFYMAASRQPTYLQLIRTKMPKIFDESYSFDPCRAVSLQAGEDVSLVATGFMTGFAIQAAAELAKEGIKVDLLHYPSVKPFDTASLIQSAKKTGRVVTVENQNIIGGLGGAVCEAVCAEYPVAVKRLGIPDRFGEVADQAYLFKKHGFGPHEIAQACRETLRENS